MKIKHSTNSGRDPWQTATKKGELGVLQFILGSNDLHDNVISLWWVHLPAPSLLNLDRYRKR
jgi:hypothetical protein